MELDLNSLFKRGKLDLMRPAIAISPSCSSSSSSDDSTEQRKKKRRKQDLKEKMGDVMLFIDDFPANSGALYCRICHEAEFESCKSLEALYSCFGTVKFAHRDCIQRWCDEKGNTTSEIYLQL
ncbi:hypothetical protein SLEP1_g54117 [Rubroshorea leprosula]|uniref:RING-CH-type domain-containing protein n=1 Tax=Rubroshorea leprosula TaxID=152421 RepID=A0AAV5MF15_9ROSI|nr:hypothetical protein SLEP1_g54117 [Rubroshorea leprosula]